MKNGTAATTVFGRLAGLLTMSLGLATFAGPAAAEMVDVSWNEGGRFEHALVIAPGKFVEVCTHLNKGQNLGWSFHSARPTQFNIHYHEGKKVEYPARLDGAKAAEGLLSVALDQDYCWMWGNKSEHAVALSLALQKQP